MKQRKPRPQDDTTKYYDSHDLMTRNAMFNFVVGGRGTGKTFDSKRYRIRHFLKTGRQFIYLRRYKTELEDKDTFFGDIIREGYFPGYEFKVDGMRGYVRSAVPEDTKPEDAPPWRLMCFFVTLSTALTKKSVPYPLVDFIIFDEFIIDKGNLHYLPDELKQFQDFYNTVDRFEDRVKVMFLANAVSIMNPYFIGLNLHPRKGARFTKAANGYIMIEMVSSDRFRAFVDSTRFGQMIKGTSYYDYAVSNTFHDDSDVMVKQKSDAALFRWAFSFDGREIGIWTDFQEGVYYVCAKVPPNAMCFVLTKDDMQPNLMMVEKSSPVLRVLKRYYMYGCVYFDSAQTRGFFNELLEYMGVR